MKQNNKEYYNHPTLKLNLFLEFPFLGTISVRKQILLTPMALVSLKHQMAQLL